MKIYILLSICMFANAQTKVLPPIEQEAPTDPGNYMITASDTISSSLPYTALVNILQGTDDKFDIVLNIIKKSERNDVGIVAQAKQTVDKAVATLVSFEPIAANLFSDPPIKSPKPKKLVPSPSPPGTDKDELPPFIVQEIEEVGPTVISESEPYNGHVLEAIISSASSKKELYRHRRSVRYSGKNAFNFVQTDKAAYKPGDLVRLRVVLVQPNLKPVTKKASIKIYDPSRNLIQQWLNETLDTGVSTQEFQLSDQPPLGTWRIKVEVDDDTYEKTFSVEEYVLPKFSVSVDPPSYALVDDEDVAITVKAKYTFGKGVVGPVTVVAQPTYTWSGNREYRMKKTGESDSSGEAVIRFTTADLRKVKLLNSYQTEVKFVATVIEALTGTQREAEATLTFYTDPMKLTLDKTTDTYKPLMDYRMIIALKQQDDEPITSLDIPRNIQLTRTFKIPYDDRILNDTQCTEEVDVTHLQVDKDGTKIITINAPLRATSMEIMVQYDKTGKGKYRDSGMSRTVYLDANQSPTNTYMQLDRVSDAESTSAGENIDFTIKLTEPLTAVIAQVVARDRVVFSTSVQVQGETTQLSVPTSTDMAPNARLVVYGVKASNREVVADAIKFNVDGLLKNKVSLSVSKEQAQPDEQVSFTVQADADSFIGLMAVDESVRLYKQGNDITQKLVENAVGGGGSYTPYYDFGFSSYSRYSWNWAIGGRTATEVFNNANLLYMTDAHMYEYKYTGRGGGGLLAAPAPMASSFPASDLESDDYGGGESAGRAGFAQPAPGGPPNQQSSKAGPGAPEPKLRTEFPETWIWTDIRSQANGTAIYSAKVPDTITAWTASAFAMNTQSGIGVAKDLAKLTVYRPFFIQMNLPYSVKRGEMMALQILVFNYEEADQEVTLTLKHSADSKFQFVNQDLSIIDVATAPAGYNTRKVTVPGNGNSVSVYFPIQPNVIGDTLLNVRAIGTTASDAVERPLLVEPEGYQVDQNQPFVFGLQESAESPADQSITLTYPPTAVQGSQRAEVNVIGDVLGPIMGQVEGLVRMPYGCGEQNMVNFVPNIVVMQYLDGTKRDEPELRTKALQFIRSGYQRELTYQRRDGSFSIFGNSDPAGSTWLTAFVFRSFKQAEKFTPISDSVMVRALSYIQKKQAANGRFNEFGEVHSKYMQGGVTGGDVPMSAYVTLALLESGDVKLTTSSTVSKAVTYLETNLALVANEPYTLALVTYALTLAKSSKADQAWTSLAALKTADNSLEYWTDEATRSSTKNSFYYWSGPKSTDVEMSAYALLTMLKRGMVEDALPVVRWLTSQRNVYGGWASTQDTVVALQALAAYAEKVYSSETDLKVTVTNGDKKHTFDVQKDNALVYQIYEVPDISLPVQLSVSGAGTAFAQVQWHYHMTEQRADRPFDCTQNVLSQGTNIVLQMCCDYKLGDKSNMAVLEINSLSGYSFEKDALNKLKKIDKLQRVETEKGDTKTNIYFASLSSESTCVNVTSEFVYQISDQKPAQMTLYDYYDTDSRIEMEYNLGDKKTLSDLCPTCW